MSALQPDAYAPLTAAAEWRGRRVCAVLDQDGLCIYAEGTLASVRLSRDEARVFDLRDSADLRALLHRILARETGRDAARRTALVRRCAIALVELAAAGGIGWLIAHVF